MAGSLGDFATLLIGSLGGKRPSPAAIKLFNSWQRWEGGHTANSATWNPLNLTAPGSGLPTINSVGVVAMPSKQAGVQRTAELLRTGYPAIAQALKTGQVNFRNPALQADLNRWLSGKRTPGVTPYVSKIAGSFGSALPVAPGGGGGGGGGARGVPPVPGQPGGFKLGTPFLDLPVFGQNIANQLISGGGRMDLLALPEIQKQSFRQNLIPVPGQGGKPATGGGPVQPSMMPTVPGKGITLPWKYKSTHETDGLQDEGFTRAIDIMGTPGTPVSAPSGGTVVYFHPTGAQGGGSMLIRFANGREAWIGHIANGLPAGTKFKGGMQLAQISPDHPRPHVHWSLR
jgi:murein DD-endopeptidase MepM/ murein hydrolase activator NlpD